MKINNQAEQQNLTERQKSIIFFADGGISEATEDIVHEHFVELWVNEQLTARMVCTPENLIELILGRMVSEGLISDLNEIEMIYVCRFASRVKVYLKDQISLTPFVEQEPSCCTGNHSYLRNLSGKQPNWLKKAHWEPEWIFSLAKDFAKDSKIHRRTQGTHSCYLAVGGKVVFQAEDLGRHNAMDKAIGYAVRNGYDRRDCMLFTTGRVPTDMVQKVVFAGIPILVSKSVPTDEAVAMAERYNLTLICKAWPDKFQLYHQAQ